jgi:DNA topoisomerase VI subunit B
VSSEIKKEIKQNVQAEKFLEEIQAGSKVDKKQDAIQKYLDSLSPSQQMLNEKDSAAEAPAPAKAKEKAKK